MRSIERLGDLGGQALRMIVAYLTLHALLLAITLIAYPQPPYLDTLSGGHSIFVSAPKYTLLNLDLVDSRERRLIILGASSASVGFRPEFIKERLPELAIHNASVGNSTITSVTETLDLIESAAPRADDVIVLGVWPGLFVDDAERFKGRPTDFTNEKLRFRFLRKTKGGTLQQVVPPTLFALLGDAYRPFLIAQRELRCPTCRFRSEAQPFNKVVSAAQMERERSEWHGFFGLHGGPWPTEQFERLLVLAERQAKAGRKVIVVELPVADWLARDNQDFASYAATKGAYWRRLAAIPGVTVLDMAEVGTPEMFSDGTHARPQYRRQWSDWLAAKVRAEL